MRKAIALLMACLSGGWLVAGHWTPVGAPYEENMALTCVVLINGEEQQSAALEVGVFCGAECRGAAQPLLFPPTQRYIFQITVFGEVGDTLNFKLFDHELNEELELTPPEAITFTIDGYGNLSEPYMLNFKDIEITQTTSHNQGWTWWSTYIEQSDVNGLTLLENELGTNGLTIKSQSQFVNYNPNTNKWTGSLKSISNEGAFMIRVGTACEVSLTGAPVNPADHPITLNPGWTWIGYPVGATMSVSDAFANITPNVGDQVKSQSGFATYNGTKWSGSLKNMEPGKGYMYKSNSAEAVILVYPDGAGE